MKYFTFENIFIPKIKTQEHARSKTRFNTHDQKPGSIPMCMLLGFDRGYCMHDQNPRSKPRSMHESKPIAGSATVEQRSNCVFLSRFGFATVVSSEWEWVSLVSKPSGSEWVLGVRVSFDPFWDVFFTYLVLE